MTVTAQVHALHTLIRDRWPGGTEDRLCAELVRTIPRSLGYMVAVTPDGWPTSTPGAPDRGNGGRGVAELTSVEAATHHRARPTASYAALCGFVAGAAANVALVDRPGVRQALRGAQRIVDEWQPPVVVQYDTVRCSAPAEDHLEPWYRPDCENIAATGRRGLCDACSMRRHRWIKANEQEGAA